MRYALPAGVPLPAVAGALALVAVVFVTTAVLVLPGSGGLMTVGAVTSDPPAPTDTNGVPDPGLIFAFCYLLVVPRAARVSFAFAAMTAFSADVFAALAFSGVNPKSASCGFCAPKYTITAFLSCR